MSRFVAPEGTTHIAFEDQQFDVGEDGTFGVPDRYDEVFSAHGYKRKAQAPKIIDTTVKEPSKPDPKGKGKGNDDLKVD